jgi:hypothetical protein
MAKLSFYFAGVHSTMMQLPQHLIECAWSPLADLLSSQAHSEAFPGSPED